MLLHWRKNKKDNIYIHISINTYNTYIFFRINFKALIDFVCIPVCYEFSSYLYFFNSLLLRNN